MNPRYLSPEQVTDLVKVFGVTLPEHGHETIERSRLYDRVIAAQRALRDPPRRRPDCASLRPQ